MKLTASLLGCALVALSAVGVLAQEQAAQPLEVVQLGWKAFKKDIASAPMPQFPHQDYVLTRNGAPPTPDYQRTGPNGEWRRTEESGTRAPKNVSPGYDESVAFQLDLRLRNVSSKEIKSFEAEVIFTNQKDVEVVRYRFKQDRSVASGRAATIEKVITGRDRKEYSKPLELQDVSDLRSQTTKRALRVLIIEFTDGSVWKAI